MKTKAKDLKENDLVWVAAMIMFFSHWDGNTPVFEQFANRKLQYVNRNLNRESLIEKV